MVYYQVIEFNNLEPLKIGAGGNKAQWDEPSKDYIPGSTIRGAVISQMLRQDVFDDIPAILQDMECYNAYPYEKGSLYIPMPQHLRIDKHDYRRAKAEVAMLGRESKPVPLSNLYEGVQKGKNSPEYRYVTIRKYAEQEKAVKQEENALQGIKIRKSYRLHQSSSMNKGVKERANLFSYQAIDPGYTFRAIIAYQDSVKRQIETVLAQTSIWYLGGSKGSGYGRCSIKLIGGAADNYESAKSELGLVASSYEDGDTLTITCLSDMLVRDDYGQPLPYIPEDFLEEKCGYAIERKDCFIQAGMTEGYNATWRARYPKETTIKAGSVLRYKFCEKLDEPKWREAVQKLEQRLSGSRTQEGFGWIAVNIGYPSRLLVYEGQPADQDSPSPTPSQTTWNAAIQEWSAIAADPQAGEVMRIISKGLSDSRGRWLRMICKKSWDMQERLKTGVGGIQFKNLKAHHCEIMKNLLQEWLKSRKLPNAVYDHKQEYRKNKDNCSIAGCSFDLVLKFLESDSSKESSGSHRPTSPETEFADLRKFADSKLNTRQGQVYYEYCASSDAANEASGGGSRVTGSMKQRLFIAELLKEGLQIYQKGRK